jgi:hypothetical protein
LLLLIVENDLRGGFAYAKLGTHLLDLRLLILDTWRRGLWSRPKPFSNPQPSVDFLLTFEQLRRLRPETVPHRPEVSLEWNLARRRQARQTWQTKRLGIQVSLIRRSQRLHTQQQFSLWPSCRQPDPDKAGFQQERSSASIPPGGLELVRISIKLFNVSLDGKLPAMRQTPLCHFKKSLWIRRRYGMARQDSRATLAHWF